MDYFKIINDLKECLDVGTPGYVKDCQTTRQKVIDLLRPLQNEFHEKYGRYISDKYQGKWPLDKLHWWSRPDEYAFLLLNIHDHLIKNKYKILEFGAGCSFLTYLIFKNYEISEYVVIDVDPDVLQFWSLVANDMGVNLRCDCVVPEFEKFDLILSVSVVEHMNEPSECIIGLCNQLDNGGRLVLTMDVDLNYKGRSGLTKSDIRKIRSTTLAASPIDTHTYLVHPNELLKPIGSWWVDDRDNLTWRARQKRRVRMLLANFGINDHERDICVLKVVYAK